MGVGGGGGRRHYFTSQSHTKRTAEGLTRRSNTPAKGGNKPTHGGDELNFVFISSPRRRPSTPGSRSCSTSNQRAHARKNSTGCAILPTVSPYKKDDVALQQPSPTQQQPQTPRSHIIHTGTHILQEMSYSGPSSLPQSPNSHQLHSTHSSHTAPPSQPAAGSVA